MPVNLAGAAPNAITVNGVTAPGGSFNGAEPVS
jgi:hypothetical protein